jgi:hypothetical protein
MTGFAVPAGQYPYGIYISRLSGPPRIYTLPRIPLPSEMEAHMLDAIFLCVGLAFFAVAVGYTLICEKL